MTTDWNGDGAPDVVVTHLNAPVALLQNQQSFDELRIQLLGTESARDAVGSVLTSGRTQKYVTAGDGYQSSGSRWNSFPAGVDQVEVQFPGGRTKAFARPANSGFYRVLERGNRMISLPR